MISLSPSIRIFTAAVFSAVFFFCLGSAFASRLPVTVQILPLAGDAADRDAEISGLAWHNDTLILLPQYPSRRSSQGFPIMYGLKKEKIERAVDHFLRGSLRPFSIGLDHDRLPDAVEGFQGFEAIAVRGDEAWLLIETRGDNAAGGVLVKGRFTKTGTVLKLEKSSALSLAPIVGLRNMGFEAMTIIGDRLVLLFEANGKNINPSPRAVTFDLDLKNRRDIPFPTVEYLVNDASAADEQGRFWVVNYFWPGEKKLLEPADDAFARGSAFTRREGQAVERLIEMHIRDGAVKPTPTAVIDLELGPDDGRNWEGIARLGRRGFLIATDRFPGTILGFVPFP
jgi:hypothetical protein